MVDETRPEVELRCLDGSDLDPCIGQVELHSLDPGRLRPFARCRYHWDRRLRRRERSMERYGDSQAVPSWFDPYFAGERWEED